MRKSLKRNIDNILDLIYTPSGAHPEIIESVSSMLHLINKVGVEMFNLVYSWSHLLTNSLLSHIVTHELFSFLPSSYSSSRLP
jgi:hypothetical protein